MPSAARQGVVIRRKFSERGVGEYLFIVGDKVNFEVIKLGRWCEKVNPPLARNKGGKFNQCI
jgi:hypothetical protein